VRDANLMFRATSASLTATETSSLTIDGTPADGLALVIDIPKQSVGTTLRPTLLHSTDGTTYTTLLTIDTVASVTAAITASKRIVRRFHTRLKYVRLILTVAGTSPDYGTVSAAIEDDTQWNVLGIRQNASSEAPA
jgi:hypothetical protein